MSNVLIGIIGSILFIGLALAGALYLGPRITGASASSTAAAVVSQMTQTSNAVDMYKVKTGSLYAPAIESDFLVPRFLKTPASNPAPAASGRTDYTWKVQLNNNVYLDGYREPQFLAKYVVVPIGTSDNARARDVCLDIDRKTGVQAIPDYSSTVDPTPGPDLGCVLGAAGSGAGGGSWFIAYKRIENASIPRDTASGYSGA